MNLYADQNTVSLRAYKLIIKLFMIISLMSNLTFQQCNPNDIKPFPRVIGTSSYDTKNNMIDVHE